jgi:osmoprotectant transport system substrate-binding protein
VGATRFRNIDECGWPSSGSLPGSETLSDRRLHHYTEGDTVIRKHTSRAAKAAFAVSFGVAIVLGLFAGTASPATKSGPTIKIGSKNFPEEYILGELYSQALQAKGFTVSYKQSIGSTEIIQVALTSGKINFYPEYTGVIVQDVFHHTNSPKTASATYALAKKLEAAKGYTLLNATPFYDTDAVAVTNATAKKYGLHTIADLKKVGSFKFGGMPECQTRNTCFVGYTKQYGLTKASFTSLGSVSAYQALDSGTVLAADVFSTDPPLSAPSKYTVLTDPKHVTGFQNVAPIVATSVVNAAGPTFTSTVNAVSAKLTLPAILAMNKAVEVDQQTPSAVAKAFLKANGLL